MHKCKFLDWKPGDLPKSEVYKPKMTAKYYGREELSSRQKRQIDVMAGYHEPIWQPMPNWIHRDTGKTYNSMMYVENERMDTSERVQDIPWTDYLGVTRIMKKGEKK